MRKCKLFVIVGVIAFFVMASNALAALDTSLQVNSTLTLDSDFNLNIGFTGDQNVGTFVIKITFNHSLVSMKSVTMPTGINVPVSEQDIFEANSAGEIEFNYFDLAMTGFDPTATDDIVIIFTANALGDASFGGTFSLAGTQPTDPVINGTYTDVTGTITEDGGGHTITASATPAEGGSITPSGSVEVADSADQTFTVTTNSGYTASVVVDGATATLTNNTYTFTGVTGDHTIAVTFTAGTTHRITASATPADGGSITPSGDVSVADGENQTFTVTPAEGYTVTNVQVDGADVTLTNNTYTFTGVTGDHTIAVTFTAGTTHTITASATPADGGSITPSGDVVVADGEDQTFTVTPATGYEVTNVQVDGSAVTLTNNAYTFTNVTADHEIIVTFNATEDKPGDADDNGTVDIFDALMIAQYDAKLKTKAEVLGYDMADVSCTENTAEEAVNIWDALEIAKYDVAKVTELTLCTQ